MAESFSKLHEKALFDRYDPEIACPKCNDKNIVLHLDAGYFKIIDCKKCGYNG